MVYINIDGNIMMYRRGILRKIINNTDFFAIKIYADKVLMSNNRLYTIIEKKNSHKLFELEFENEDDYIVDDFSRLFVKINSGCYIIYDKFFLQEISTKANSSHNIFCNTKHPPYYYVDAENNLIAHSYSNGKKILDNCVDLLHFYNEDYIGRDDYIIYSKKNIIFEINLNSLSIKKICNLCESSIIKNIDDYLLNSKGEMYRFNRRNKIYTKLEILENMNVVDFNNNDELYIQTSENKIYIVRECTLLVQYVDNGHFGMIKKNNIKSANNIHIGF